MNVPEKIIQRLEARKRTRILLFGSSNTQRRLFGMTWGDCLELALIKTYGTGLAVMINTGIGGHSSRDLLDRFDEDAAFYKPHLVFITVGGNDAFHSATNAITPRVFEANLRELHARFAALRTLVIFQTYYAFDRDRLDPRLHDLFLEYMEVVRLVAQTTPAYLIDHLFRWEPLRLRHPEVYLSLMQDPQHVLDCGNMVMGLDIARHFKYTGFLGRDDPAVWRSALNVQHLMDRLMRGG